MVFALRPPQAILLALSSTKRMRVRDDPRAAAELFCRQNGVTDAETVDLVEETLRELYFPTPSSPPPSSPQPPLLPEASTQKWPRTADKKPGSLVRESHRHGTPRRAETLRGSEAASGSGEDTAPAHKAGGPEEAFPGPSTSDLSAEEIISESPGTSRRAVNQPQNGQRQDRQHDRRYLHSQHDREQGSSGEGKKATAAAAVAAATPAGEPSAAEINVMELAARMRGESKQILPRR